MSNQGQYQQPLLGGDNAVPHQIIYVENEESRRKKAAAAGGCCCLLTLLVLLLTLLIPRGPSIELTGGMIELSGVPLSVNASFLFTNNNFYEMEYKNLHFGIYSISEFGKIGTASYAGPINLKAKRSQVINVGIEAPAGLSLNIANYCRKYPSLIMFLSNATVEAKCNMRNFGLTNVYSPSGVFFMCQA